MKILLIFLSLVVFVAGKEMRHIDVSFFMDKSGQDAYMYNEKKMDQGMILKEVDFMITEVNKLYKQLDITIYKKGQLTFMSTDPYDKGDNHPILRGFSDYANLKDTGDIAVLLTGQDLILRGKRAAGLCFKYHVCEKQDNTAIVESKHGTYHVITYLAHEIGHVLGATDRFGGAFGYIMDGTGGGGGTKWKSESIEEIERNLGHSHKSCQYEKLPDSTETRQSLPDFLNTPDKICARQGSWMLNNPNQNQNRGGDSICRLQFFTCAENKGKGQMHGVLNGMICGEKKTCQSGKCVTDSNANTGNAKDDCPYGDASHLQDYPWGNKELKTCKQIGDLDWQPRRSACQNWGAACCGSYAAICGY